LRHVQVCERARRVPAKRVAHDYVRSLDAGRMQRAVQLVGDAHARARHRTGAAEARTGTVVAAGPRPLRDPRLDHGPRGRPVLPSRIEEDCGRAAPLAVEVQLRPICRRHNPSGARVDLVAGSDSHLRSVNQAGRNQGHEQFHHYHGRSSMSRRARITQAGSAHQTFFATVRNVCESPFHDCRTLPFVREWEHGERHTMKRLAILLVAIVACQSSQPAEHYGFIARLGTDTVSVERVARRGNEIVSDEVDRFPRVRRRHTTIRIAADGTVSHLEMDIITPSEPSNERKRRVVVDVTADSVHITKSDSTGTNKIAFATGGALTMPHLPQMYSLTDLYFGAALKRAGYPGDSVELRQYYIDREFDRFPLHHGVVRLVAANKAELHHDWLSGYGDATFDSPHRMLTYSGARSTYKVEVQRLGTM